MQKHGYLIHTWSDKSFKGTVVNRVLPSLDGGLLEITLTVLSTQNIFGKQCLMYIVLILTRSILKLGLAWEIGQITSWLAPTISRLTNLKIFITGTVLFLNPIYSLKELYCFWIRYIHSRDCIRFESDIYSLKGLYYIWIQYIH